MRSETIAAIATGLSESGIGIIRISGEEAVAVGDRMFRSAGGKRILEKAQSHTIHYGYIVDYGRSQDQNEDWRTRIVDEVMVSLMRAPRSYTREDTVEISCHGGVLLMRRILELALQNGARMAEPGEFTRRAFLNGRIDLSQAEAVMDMIQSRNKFAMEASVRQLKGDVSCIVRRLREEILYEIAFIESALDDPEHVSLEGYGASLADKVEFLRTELKKLIASADNGRLLKEGINTVIVGKPNVGKSSLLNLLVGEERAIVTEIAGTTRDVLSEFITLGGIGLNVIDTAGIRNTQDVVERIGVERAREFAARADLIIYVVDASVALDESDMDIISMLVGKKSVVLLNKTDLECVVEEEELRRLTAREDIRIIRTSTRENKGIKELENMVRELFFHGEIKTDSETVITSMRHKEALQEALEGLEMVKNSLEQNMPEDFYSIDLMSAYASLGRIIGEEVGEDLVNEIFSRFCMGK